MNKVAGRVAVAAGVLLLAAMMLHTLRSRRTPPAAEPRLEIPVASPAIVPSEPARIATPGKAVQSPERLLPLLEKLGRARLVRDRRSQAELRRRLEPIYEEDFEWIRGRLAGDLIAAAGAAELVVAFGRGEAVGDLAAVLARATSSTLLKDVAIDALGELKGDGAVAALVTAARNDADEGVRARAASALGGFVGPEAYITLTAVLRDPSAVVRSAAATALLRMPSRDAVVALMVALAAETDPRIQADLAVAAYSMSEGSQRVDVVQAILARPALLGVVEERRRVKDDSRYRPPYDRSFFEPGQRPVERPTAARRVGITVETGPTLTLPEAAARLFAAAPLDRYRDWFRLRKAEEFPSARAYDSYGQPAGDVPYDDLDGTVFLRFRDPKSFDPGVLGYTRGCEAFVSDVSMLHEFGHAFARLGDEYAEGTAVEAPNVARTSPPVWERLITGATLSEPVHRDKSYLVPSADCHMANRAGPTRFCPVCQLEIHARMWEVAGAPLPW